MIYGLAAVSRLPRPLPMMKMAAQNPPKECFTRHGQAIKELLSLASPTAQKIHQNRNLPNSVEAQPPNERRFVAIVAQDPVRVA